MKSLTLNETPVRTSCNFNINNIKLSNIDIPESLKEFKNFNISKTDNNIKIEEENDKPQITYGLGKIFTDQVCNNANKKLKINIDGENNNINFDFKFNKENANLVSNIQIIAKENSKATINIIFESDEDVQAYNNGIIKLVAKENADIRVIIANLLNQKSLNFLAIENELSKNSNVEYTVIDIGGKSSVTNYYSNQLGDFSNNVINSIYLGKDEQIFDLNYIAEQRGEKSNIDIDVQGALSDCAKKHFKGTIDFKKGCKKATGNENESCMLLSDTAKSLALPMLLCSEDDVQGNHSSSAGKIGEKELFYIMSRGFEHKEALKLMVRAKFNKILDNIEDKSLKDRIVSEIDRKLD